jgi:hypothetical protein
MPCSPASDAGRALTSKSAPTMAAHPAPQTSIAAPRSNVREMSAAASMLSLPQNG